jgi:outer membrane protein assembly factor BamD
MARRALPLMLLLAIALVGCGPKTKRILSCEDYYQRGTKYIEEKDWVKAKEAFEQVTLRFPGCEKVDDAQFMLGEVYYRQGLYIEADYEYKRVVSDFRLSDRKEDAQYKIALCAFEQCFPAALDQSLTKQAIFRLRLYFEDYPRGEWAKDARGKIQELRERLAKKDYNTARFYHRQNYDEAALIYLGNVLTNYADAGEWVDRARFLKARILLERGRKPEAMILLRAIRLDGIRPRMREDVLALMKTLNMTPSK